MAEISASVIKDLREKTGAGMMDCKKALTENNGDIEAATDWLRTKGLAKAAKKAGRTAAEGLVAIAIEGNRGIVIEVNSETDFVSRNDKFQDLVSGVAKAAIESGAEGIDALTAAPYPGKSHSVGDEITEAVAVIGENMQLRRFAGLQVEPGVVAGYVHSAVASNMGKIAVLVALKSTGNAEALQALGKQIAMHVAAARPEYLTQSEVDNERLDRERAVFSEQAKASGKPENVIEKMVEGRIRKFYEEVVLLDQLFVIDGKTKISEVVKAAEKGAGAPIELTGFVSFVVGEGVEKEETDFAAEVAAASGVAAA